MKVDEIHIKDVENKLHTCIKKKRERAVFKDGSDYYKIWVPNWTKAEVTKVAIDCGFYDEYTAPVLTTTIFDESGQRGYITKEGKSVSQYGGKNWKGLVEQTTIEQRKEFLVRAIDNSLSAKGTFLDFFPANMVLYDNKISFIDLDSFGSFNFVFEGVREWYEKFELDAWWKPLETSRRDLNISLREYLKECLDIKYEDKIDSENDFLLIKDLLEGI